MASFKIKRKDCISCGECEILCHVKAIKQDTRGYYIDNKICVGCGACVSVCPIKAIYEYIIY